MCSDVFTRAFDSMETSRSTQLKEAVPEETLTWVVNMNEPLPQATVTIGERNTIMVGDEARMIYVQILEERQ